MIRGLSPKGEFIEVTKKNMYNDIVESMISAILIGVFSTGDRLVETELAKKFGVSRTPIRESLFALLNLGLIKMEANYGAIVLEFGPKQLLEVFQVRQFLEAGATRLSIGRIPKDQLHFALQETQQMLALASDNADWSRKGMELDVFIHDLIAKFCSNARLANEIIRYCSLVEAVRIEVGNRYHIQEQGMKEHTTILQSLLEEDPDAAANAMREHIQNTGNAAAKVMMEIRDKLKNHTTPIMSA